MAQAAIPVFVTYPITFVKTLIQIGHEPLPPKPTTTLFGKKALCLPNCLQYMRHVKRRDGFLALYRGVGYGIVGAVVGKFTAEIITEKLKEAQIKQFGKGEDIPQDGSLEDAKRTAVDTCIYTASRCSEVIVTYPLTVLMTRSIAQFVGGETVYSSFLCSVQTVWKEEGILGFFKGLIARLTGEILTIWLVNSLVFVTDRYVLNGNKILQSQLQGLPDPTHMLASQAVARFTYPFLLVSNIMILNNCSLAAGNSYASWTDCYSQMSRQGQLKRGASLFFRYCSTPVA